MKKLFYVLVILSVFSCNGKKNIENTNDIIDNYSYEEIVDVYQSKNGENIDTTTMDTLLRRTEKDSLFTAIKRMGMGVQKAVYGIDNRKDYYQLTDEAIKKNSEKTCALIPIQLLYPLNDNEYKLLGTELGKRNNLCKGQNFYNDLSVSFCSGFAIGDSLIATAGHCMNENDFNFVFVFGFKQLVEGQQEFIIPKENVFSPRRIIKKKLDSSNDYGVYEVFGKIPCGRITKIEYEKVKKKQRVYVIGHPSGISQKVATQATVREVNRFYAKADLDTFGGNSGSPVFSAKTNKVVGILVRGEIDYIKSPDGCSITKICMQKDCQGEDFTLIEYIEDYY